MAYPGDGYKMSNYGLKTYSPEQSKEMWKEAVHREQTIVKQHSSTKLLLPGRGPGGEGSQGNTDASTTSPASPPAPPQISYFGKQKTHEGKSGYDQAFHFSEGYNNKLRREDMHHTQGLDIHGEEEGKTVPLLSSSVYGQRRHRPLEQLYRDHARVELVKRDFYRPHGTDINPTRSE